MIELQAPRLGSLAFDWLPEGTSYRPGEQLRFAWHLSSLWLALAADDPSLAHVNWATADLELRLVANDEVLWRRRAFRWPPRTEAGYVLERDASGSFHIVPVAWPPAGYTIEGPLVPSTAGGKRDLYNGFEEKELELRLIGHPSDGDPQTYSATRSIWIQPESTRSFGISAPTFVSIGDRFTVTGTVANELGHAAVTVHANPTQLDVHSGQSEELTPVDFEASARGVDSEPVATPVPVTWRWVDMPTYHVHSDDLERDLQFSCRVHWEDEYGNRYPDLTASPVVVRIRVSDTKVAAANAAEDFYWTNVGITIGVAVIAAVLTVASAGVGSGAAAGLVIGLAVAQGAVGAVGAAGGAASSYGYGGWAAIADDPITPDPNYWHPVRHTPRELPATDVLPSYLRSCQQLGHISDLILLSSVAAGRILGAKLAGATDAVDQRLKDLVELRKQLAAATSALAESTEPAIAELEATGLDHKTMSKALEELRSGGLTEEQREQLLELGISHDAVDQLQEALKMDSVEQVVQLRKLISRLHAHAIHTAEAGLHESRGWVVVQADRTLAS
jgi:hypothetical protein